jgi:AcrR family transcriptional regulator
MPRVAAPPDVRAAIVDAATVLMERYGFQKMTIDDIAHEAGIGKATIYGYFENKQEVGLAVIDRYHAEVRERQLEICHRDQPSSEILRLFVLERVMSAFDKSDRYCKSMDDSLATLRPIVLAKRGRFREEEAQMLAELIERGMGAGEFRAGDALTWARTVLTCVGGLMPYSLSPRERNDRETVVRQTNEVLDLILRGMAMGVAAEPDDEGRTNGKRNE